MTWEHEEEGLLVDVDEGTVLDVEGNETDVGGALCTIKGSKPKTSTNSSLSPTEGGKDTKDVKHNSNDKDEGNVNVLTVPDSEMGVSTDKPGFKASATTPVIEEETEEETAKKEKKQQMQCMIWGIVVGVIVLIIVIVALSTRSKSDGNSDALDATPSPSPVPDTTGRPTLEVFPLVPQAGENGEPADAFPLQICQADCDRDGDCAEGLGCFVRDIKDDLVPDYCDGVPIGDEDYCVKKGYAPTKKATDAPPGSTEGQTEGLPDVPESEVTDQPTDASTLEPTDAPTPEPTENTKLEVFPLEPEAGQNGEPEGAFPLQICQADCDGDDECAEGLVCLQRGGLEDPIPGYCDGTPIDDEDYCVKEGDGRRK